ncbi:MAG: class I SAM-dependent methyltransferase [Melioribacteraceae bacterium]|nr:MAG: class I SAM-dependent methyltransferase [Melioribacteraceae bacterium]
MKVRDSGMPHEEMWNSFFDAPSILKKLGMNSGIKDAVEFGSGYGTFSIPASLLISGNLYAIDIEKEMIESLNEKIIEKNISNIKIIQRDFVAEGTGLKENSADYVMMFNILHEENTEKLLREAYRILKAKGKIGIIHWIHSAETPRGPSLDVRPTPEQCIKWLINSGLKTEKNIINLPPYHYGITGIKL